MNAKILIVDDSSLARRSSRRILEEMGLTVDEATGGAQALEKFFLSPPDLVLLDMVMSGMYGLEVLTKLKELDPGVRVIVATADIQKSTREQARAAGAAGFVNKPLDPAKLRELISKVLEGVNTWII